MNPTQILKDGLFSSILSIPTQKVQIFLWVLLLLDQLTRVIPRKIRSFLAVA
uniref:Uncharacterized protein n=1 Tax=Rhizophora mucronata TaxID=61149 RepID=A0A2P2MXG2_RHIMU